MKTLYYCLGAVGVYLLFTQMNKKAAAARAAKRLPLAMRAPVTKVVANSIKKAVTSKLISPANPIKVGTSLNKGVGLIGDVWDPLLRTYMFKG